MSVISIIPARFNSTRFPGKLLKLIGDKTVLQMTFEQAKKCNTCSALYVATDDLRIKEHIETLGGNVILTSPDCPNGTMRIREAFFSNSHLQKADIIVNFQGDHPLTSPSTIDAIVEALQKDPSAMMATAASPIENESDYRSPHLVKCVFDQNKNALYFSRAPIPYTRPNTPFKAFAHIGLYAYRTQFFTEMERFKKSFLQEAEDLEQLQVLENGFRIKIAEVEEFPLGVDTPEDLEKLKNRVLTLCLSNTYS